MKRLIIIAALTMLSIHAYASNIELNRSEYIEACADTIYTTDPLIALATAMGKKMGPGVKGEIREICGCFADEVQVRLDTNSYTVDDFDWSVYNQFAFFQTRNLQGIEMSTRVNVINDTKKCAPHMLQ